jgi:hypothetical protein
MTALLFELDQLTQKSSLLDVQVGDYGHRAFGLGALLAASLPLTC